MMELWNEFDRLVVFDTETTGIEFGTDRIIEIGAAALENGEEQGDFNALIRLTCGADPAALYHPAYRHYR